MKVDRKLMNVAKVRCVSKEVEVLYTFTIKLQCGLSFRNGPVLLVKPTPGNTGPHTS